VEYLFALFAFDYMFWQSAFSPESKKVCNIVCLILVLFATLYPPISGHPLPGIGYRQ